MTASQMCQRRAFTWANTTGRGSRQALPLSFRGRSSFLELDWRGGCALVSSISASTCQTESRGSIYAPLNLTGFIRLVVRLAERGCPAHWLGTVLENLASGVIQATARAPGKRGYGCGANQQDTRTERNDCCPVGSGVYDIPSRSRTSVSQGSNCASRISSLFSNTRILERCSP